MGVGVSIQSGGPRLAGYVSRVPTAGRADVVRPGLVLCRGFPSGAEAAAVDDDAFPKLTDRLAGESGWTVLTFSFRGTGQSEGDFSVGGWIADVRAAVDFMLEVEQVTGVWLAGFVTGGAMAICTAAEDDRVRGVASLGAPADFHLWAEEPLRFLDHARSLGIV